VKIGGAVIVDAVSLDIARGELRKELDGVRDIERLAGKAASGRISPRELGGLRHDDVGVNVDRRGGRTPGEAVRIVVACGGASIAVLAIDH